MKTERLDGVFIPKRSCEGAPLTDGKCPRCGIANATEDTKWADERCLSFVGAMTSDETRAGLRICIGEAIGDVAVAGAYARSINEALAAHEAAIRVERQPISPADVQVGDWVRWASGIGKVAQVVNPDQGVMISAGFYQPSVFVSMPEIQEVRRA